MPARSSIRDQFPFLAECTYLDAAAAGLSAPGIGAAVAHHLDQAKSRGILGRDEWRAKQDRLKDRLTNLLSIPSEDLSFTSSTSEGINLFAHSLAWRAGDEIAFAADEYPTLCEAWRPAVAAGAVLVPVDISVCAADETEREDAILRALSSRTRVLALSQVHWVKGTRIDLARVGRACRANGTILVVDGVQALGATPVDLAYVDVYSAATFKWLLSGFGFALLVMREWVRAQLSPAFRGAVNALTAGPAQAFQLQYAHPNYSGIYALDASLQFFESFGWASVHSQIESLTKRLHDGLERIGLPSETPRDRTAGIVSIRLADAETAAVQLSSRAIRVTSRQQAIRVSPHCYNNESDIDRLLNALSEQIATAPQMLIRT